MFKQQFKNENQVKWRSTNDREQVPGKINPEFTILQCQNPGVSKR